MSICPYCLLGSRKSRIRGDIAQNCAKYRSGPCSACERLARIDRQVEEARRVLTQLLDEREGLACIINSHHDPFSNRLPVELASKILEHSLPTIQDYLDDIDNCLDLPAETWIKSVLSLSSTCKSWRAISHHTPQLWNFLFISVANTNCTPSIAMIRQCLQWAGNLPLYVQLHVSYTDNDINALTHELISYIVPTAHRWQILDLKIPRSLLRFLSRSLSNQSLLLLTHLRYHVNGGGSVENSGFEAFKLNASPRTLKQSCNTMTSGLCKVSVGFDNLTCFVSHYDIAMNVQDCVHLFGSAVRLSSCELESVIGSRVAGPVVRSASLRKLETSEIEDDGFWNHFEFPQLEDLRMGIYHDSWSSLSALIRRSGCVIKELDLLSNETRPHDVMEVLTLTPGLRRLHLDSPLILGQFFFLLDAAASQSQGFLPKLESLRCDLFDSHFDWKPLLLFLTTMSSRSGPTLRSFRFDYEDVGQDIMFDLLKPMSSDQIRLLMDATTGMESVSVLNTEGHDIVVDYLAGRYESI